MATLNVTEYIQKVIAIKEKYSFIYDFSPNAIASVPCQMLSSFSKARLELGITKASLYAQFPNAPESEKIIVTGLIDTLLNRLYLQESKYWMALAFVHAHFQDRH